jgi:hypothetical protein
VIVEVHQDALAEMVDAAVFYERRKRGLGNEFSEAVLKAWLEIEANPVRVPRANAKLRGREIRT